MSVCTGTRVPAKTGVPLRRPGDVVISGSLTLMSDFLWFSSTQLPSWLTLGSHHFIGAAREPTRADRARRGSTFRQAEGQHVEAKARRSHLNGPERQAALQRTSVGLSRVS